MTKPLGLSDAQSALIENILRSFFKTKTQFAVFIFGSRARGDFRQYSDLDLWIESVPTLTRHEETTLRTSFEESDLTIKVDIVTPESCLEAYAANIAKEKKVWFST